MYRVSHSAKLYLDAPLYLVSRKGKPLDYRRLHRCGLSGEGCFSLIRSRTFDFSRLRSMYVYMRISVSESLSTLALRFSMAFGPSPCSDSTPRLQHPWGRECRTFFSSVP